MKVCESEKTKLSAIEYLKQIRKCNVQIENLKTEIEIAEYKMTGIAGNIKSETRSSSINNLSPQDKHISKIYDYKEKLKEKYDELYDLKLEIINMIEKLKDFRSMNIIYKRYVLCLQWEEIAELMFIDKRTVMRNHKKALYEFNKIYESCH